MVSLFSSLNMTANALSVNESAISVVSHNVANMNTEGYSKQKVNLATRNVAGAIGDSVEAQIRANGGVMIASVTRYNDAYLNNYYRDQLSILKGYEEQLGNLGDLAEIFDDLKGEGIDTALSNFYDALNNLNEYPASSTARINFIETAKTLTATLNTKSVQLDELTSKALGDGISQEALENSEIYNKFEAFNDKLTELAEINKALAVTQTGTLEANNLLDKRDMVLNKIAEFIDINIEEKPNGSVDLYAGGEKLVSGSEVKGKLQIQTAASYCEANGLIYPDEWVTEDGKPREAAVISIVNPENPDEIIVSDANSVITTGVIGGLLHSADLEVDGMNAGVAKDSLNKLAKAIAEVFNDLNTRDGAYAIDPNDTGKLVATNEKNVIFGNFVQKIDPNTNQPVFDPDTGEPIYELEEITAGNISINSSLLTNDGIWNLSCAYFAEGENFDERAVGNAQNVAAMLGTRNEKQDSLNGMSVEDFYTGLVGKIAAGGSNSQNLVDTQNDVVDSIYNKILANNSVDLNEELVDLVKYQTAYSAAAQVFNTCNACLDTLMTLGR